VTRTISVIIPALNEEANILGAVDEVIAALGNRFEDYELLLFDDGSQDRTGELMDSLARANPRVRVTHNDQSRNLGGVYKQGIAAARFDYLFLVPGDNEITGSALVRTLDAIGKADLVIPYPTNMHVRPWIRRIGSRAYTFLINLLFGRRLNYYNGTVICRTADARSIIIRTDSFAYQSEALLKLLRAGKTYVEVGIEIRPLPGRRSNALRLRNLIAVFKAVRHLVVEIHGKPKENGSSR
jgi:dolichol-phosphate mannosyltransferase